MLKKKLTNDNLFSQKQMHAGFSFCLYFKFLFFLFSGRAVFQQFKSFRTGWQAYKERHIFGEFLIIDITGAEWKPSQGPHKLGINVIDSFELVDMTFIKPRDNIQEKYYRVSR